MGTHDVVVIGGGIAGVTAARDMGEDGLSVLLLEARNRLGSRTYYRRFANTEHAVEFGGTWIAPRWQRYVAREVERYDLSLTESPEHTSFASLVGGMRLDTPRFIPRGEEEDRDRAIDHIARASRRLDPLTPLAEPDAELDVPLTTFLEEVRLPEATRDFMMAWLSSAFGCEPHEVSALNVLSLAAAHGHDARAWSEGDSEVLKFAQGTRILLEAMIEDSGADVRTSTPVGRVEQDGAGVVVRTHAGDAFSASAAVVALPLNVLKHVHFSPELGEEKRLASEEGHAGHSVKVWALVEGAPPYFEGVGHGPKGLKWIGTEHELPEGSLMVGFGSDPRGWTQRASPTCKMLSRRSCPAQRCLRSMRTTGTRTRTPWAPGRRSGRARSRASAPGFDRRRGDWPSRRPTWRSDGRGTSTGRSRAGVGPPSAQKSYSVRRLERTQAASFPNEPKEADGEREGSAGAGRPTSRVGE